MTPKIYVASLSDYNAGTLHGAWIDATQDVEDIEAEIAEMLKSSPARLTCENCDYPIKAVSFHDGQGKEVEVFHHDMVAADGSNNHTVCNWGTDLMVGVVVATPSVAEEYAIHDYDDFGGISLGEHESLETVHELADLLDVYGNAYAAYVSNVGLEYADAEGFQEAYIGEMTALEYAYEYIDATGMLSDVPESLRNYFDYESFARDMVLGGDVYEVDGYLFNGNV